MLTLRTLFGDGFAIRSAEISGIISEFFDCVDPGKLEDLVSRYKRSMDSQQVLTDVIFVGRRFVLGMEAVLDFHAGRMTSKKPEEYADTLFFMKYYSAFYKVAGAPQKTELWGKLRDGFNPNSDLRHFFSELYVAFAYASYGCDIDMVDMDNANPLNYEFDIRKEDKKLEVEVKTISSLSGLSGIPMDSSKLEQVISFLIRQLDKAAPKFQNAFVSITLGGCQRTLKDFAISIEKCVQQLNVEKSIIQHGDVRIAYKQFGQEELDQLWNTLEESFSVKPAILNQHMFLGKPRNGPFQGIVGVKFNEKWRIENSVKSNLKDAFKKFSGSNAAVVWLILADMDPPIVDGRPENDAIMGNRLVLEEIAKYLSAKKISYPTGIVLSFKTLALSKPGSPENLFMPLVLTFFPGEKPVDHKFFMNSDFFGYRHHRLT